jgi:hypothetical protein
MVYESGVVQLIDGTEIYVTPLKIKYLREFMDAFKMVKESNSDDESLVALVNCVRIAMKQFFPEIKTSGQVEDSMDINAVYKILDYCAGIKINEDSEEEIKDQASKSGPTWDELDIVALESEVFLLGIWKDYDELESSLSMEELVVTLNAKRDADYQDKKFMAAMQGVDLDKQSGKQNEWEEMKARVFSKGKASNANDILAYQGVNAQKAGFGIGMGINYEKIG